ncbi:MAG: 2-oxoglutarate ferredoxin oxidoreductase subunit alpha, partial [Planctomycetaceae bacterium]
ANHQHMTEVRAAKVKGVANFIPEQDIEGPESGDLLVVSWGGTYGSVRSAVRQCIQDGKSVAHAHVRYLNPFPKNLEAVLRNYNRVLAPELNDGQLRLLLRSQFLIDVQGYNKVQGKPFLIGELINQIDSMLEDNS